MRPLFSFVVLVKVWLFSRIFYRLKTRWIGTPEQEPWRDLRLICFLNHTSLFEWLFAGVVPFSMLWEIATRAVVPVADKTLRRPVVGGFIGLLVRHPVSITREADHTWQTALSKIDPNSMVIILPEGRMRRATGLDSKGRPMTVRGGIADILEVMQEGRMLIAYSGGLHHVQVPGERFPRLFRNLRMNFELLEIAEYRRARLAEVGTGSFKRAVKRDLDRRRDLYSPMTPESTHQPPESAAAVNE